MNILVNVPYSLFEQKSAKRYVGPLHFSSMFLKSFEKSPHSFTAIVFEKTTPRTGTYFKSRVVKDGKNKWLVFNIWISTVKIVRSRQRMDKETASLIKKVKKAIQDTAPDAFFLNGFSALTFLLMQSIKELGMPTISTHHGIWYKEYIALKKKYIKSPIRYRKELEKDTVRISDKNIFLSNLSLQVFEKNLMKVPKNQLELVKIPYNPAFVNRQYPKPNKSKPLKLLLVGRWDAVKNHEAYLALAKRAKELGLGWTFYSVCNIGPYPHYDDIREDYLKHIKVIPTMSAQKLKKMYQKCNVVVMPSHFDVYPGVITESVLQNRPSVISPNVGWVDEFRRHGVEHWITDFKDTDKTLKRIAEVSKDQVPKSLYNEVLRHNNPEDVFRKYYQLFEEITQE
jgi:glycosyltransferase involved in cell wall biosynthesis